MKFSVEVRRIRTDFVRVDVEADNYSEAGTKGLELARNLSDDKFESKDYIKTKFQLSSTDKRGE